VIVIPEPALAPALRILQGSGGGLVGDPNCGSQYILGRSMDACLAGAGMKISTQPRRGFMDPAERLEIASGLFPQKMLEALVLHEVARSRRYPSPISLMYFALRYPENASAQVLESAQLFAANLLHSKLRDADLPGHYEGNYLVIMPATDGPGARIAAERLLAAFRGSQITRAAELFEISISVGVSSHPGGEGISISALLSGASSALWEAQKRGPKNLVVYEEMQADAG